MLKFLFRKIYLWQWRTMLPAVSKWLIKKKKKIWSGFKTTDTLTAVRANLSSSCFSHDYTNTDINKVLLLAVLHKSCRANLSTELPLASKVLFSSWFSSAGILNKTRCRPVPLRWKLETNYYTLFSWIIRKMCSIPTHH